MRSRHCKYLNKGDATAGKQILPRVLLVTRPLELDPATGRRARDLWYADLRALRSFNRAAVAFWASFSAVISASSWARSSACTLDSWALCMAVDWRVEFRTRRWYDSLCPFTRIPEFRDSSISRTTPSSTFRALGQDSKCRTTSVKLMKTF